MTSERRHARHFAGVTRLLASVTTEGEALIAAAAGADIIDCKNPSEGALGALPPEVVAGIRRAVPDHIPISATIGDLPLEPSPVLAAVERMAATGADIVKIGVFPGAAPLTTIDALAPVARKTKLVAVMLADREPDFTLIAALARAGFAGVMLDTAGKSGATLLDHMTSTQLKGFLLHAEAAGLMSGLAGSLKAVQIPQLLSLRPDVLGFRGALCHAGNRQAGLDRAAMESVRRAIPRASHHDTTLELERSS